MTLQSLQQFAWSVQNSQLFPSVFARRPWQSALFSVSFFLALAERRRDPAAPERSEESRGEPSGARGESRRYLDEDISRATSGGSGFGWKVPFRKISKITLLTCSWSWAYVSQFIPDETLIVVVNSSASQLIPDEDLNSSGKYFSSLPTNSWWRP